VVHGFAEGPNDGLVAVRSAVWCAEFFRPPVVVGDHRSLLSYPTFAAWWAGRASLLPQIRQMRQFYAELCEEHSLQH
jgi:hypothetical protein